MKTSKIILVSFVSLVVLFLLSLLIQKPQREHTPVKTEVHEMTLPAIHFLQVNNSERINLHSDTSNRITVLYLENKKPEHWPYRISIDTLIIDSLAENPDIGIYLDPATLHSISLKESEIRINRFNQSYLSIEGYQCRVSINDCLFDTLHADLRTFSELTADNQPINYLSLKLDRSNCQFYSEQIRTLTAELRDTSELSVNKVISNRTDSDESSRFYSR